MPTHGGLYVASDGPCFSLTNLCSIHVPSKYKWNIHEHKGNVDGTSMIDTLWKPSTVTVLQGIMSVLNNSLGTLVLGLHGSESRPQLQN